MVAPCLGGVTNLYNPCTPVPTKRKKKNEKNLKGCTTLVLDNYIGGIPYEHIVGCTLSVCGLLLLSGVVAI